MKRFGVLGLLTLALGFSCAGAANAGRKNQTVDKRKAVAAQLWNIGLHYFAVGETDLAHVQWLACTEMDPANEECRQALAGLDKLAKAEPPSGSTDKEVRPASASGAPDLLEDPQARRQEAIRHWNAGILRYQNGEYVKARDEWALCGLLDPKNADCPAGLQRAAQAMAKAPAADKEAQSTKVPGSRAEPEGTAADKEVRAAAAREEAIRHWNAGITYFQGGNYVQAKEEWLLCRKSDPANLDCQTGIQRVEQTYGGGR